MSVIYRQLRPEEEDAVLDLWVEVFPDTDREQWQREFVWDPQRFRQTYIAVEQDGAPLASVRYTLKRVRDAGGMARLVGQVSNVVTKESAQKQGHAGRLLERAIDAMREDGCMWSLLSADDDVSGFYERYGWRGFPMSYRQGLLTGDRPQTSIPYTIQPYDPNRETDGWEALASVYSAYNATRPLTVARDLPYWKSFVAMRFNEWSATAGATVLAATRPGADRRLSGYALAHFQEMGILVSEIAAQPGDEAAVTALLATIIDQGLSSGLDRARVFLPGEPHIEQALQRIFGQTLHQGFDYYLMARPIAPECSDQHIDDMFKAPGAICWPIDDY